jgi:hypothetical protein
MPCVVKASKEDKAAKWLTGPRLGGFRTFARRESAEIFETESKAQDAILAMVTHAPCDGIAFSVEAADKVSSTSVDAIRR